VSQEPEVFRHFIMDMLGAVVPDEKLKYNYALVVICAATHYTFAFPLTAPTTRNICNALIKMFEITGLPSEMVITSDNASYFRFALMREFNKRLGISPRFSTPYHPEGHAMVERVIYKMCSGWWLSLPMDIKTIGQLISVQHYGVYVKHEMKPVVYHHP